jgi:transposase-like protein
MDAVHWVQLDSRFGTARADRSGLPPVSLSRLWQTVQRAQREPAEPETQYPSDVIALVVLWRLRYKLSLRDLPEMFLIRGIVFSHEAVRDWEAKLTPALAEGLRRRRRGKVGNSWYVDETYIKVHGHWRYLYRAIDRSGALVDVMFSERRDMAAAKAFFQSARTVTDMTPDRVTTTATRVRSGRRWVSHEAPHQPLPQQSTGAGSPWYQRSLPTDAWVQVPTIGKPVLSRLR